MLCLIPSSTAFSQQLVTRAPYSLVKSCLLIGSYTSCYANWMLEKQSRIQDVTCNVKYHNHDAASTNGEPEMRPMSMYHMSPFHTMCLMYLLYTVSQFHTTCPSSIPHASVPYLPVCPALHFPVQHHLPSPEDPPSPDQAVVSK